MTDFIKSWTQKLTSNKISHLYYNYKEMKELTTKTTADSEQWFSRKILDIFLQHPIILNSK